MTATSRGVAWPAATRPDPEPLPPVEPALSDCCGSGCSPCIFDLHQDALERYQAELARWQQRQRPTRERGQGPGQGQGPTP